MPTVGVSRAASRVPASPDSDMTITNTGFVTVYVGDSADVSAASGYPLAAGSTVVWDAGRPLYLQSTTDTSVFVMANSGAVFDASAVAAQLKAQGLAQDIANDILSTGVKVVNATAVLSSGYHATSTVFNSFQLVAAPLDTTQAQSIHVRLRINGVHVPANAATDYVTVSAFWDWDAGAGLFGQVQPVAFYAPGGQWVDLWLPVHGDNVWLVGTNFTATTFDANVDVIASQRVIDRPRVSTSWAMPGWNTAAQYGERLSVSATNVAVPGASPAPLLALPVRAGNLQVTLQPNGNVTGQGRYALTDETGVQFDTQLMVVGTIGAASITTMQAQVGLHPVYVRQLIEAAGPTGFSIFAAWDK